MGHVAAPGETPRAGSDPPPAAFGQGAPLRACVVLHAVVLVLAALSYALWTRTTPSGEDAVARRLGFGYPFAGVEDFLAWHRHGEPLYVEGVWVRPESAMEYVQGVIPYDVLAPAHVQFGQLIVHYVTWSPLALVLVVATVVTAYRLT